MLEHPNLTVTACHHPDEVIKHLQESPYDLLLTDIQMPGMNGFDLLKAVRKVNQEIPVIALTARNDMDEAQFRSHGFAGCLNKPFTQKELMQLLSAVCKRPSFDFSSLTDFSMDDAEASAEIMRTFIDETQKKKEKLQQSLTQKDMNTATGIAHQLLPLFKMLNAETCLPSLLWLEERRNETHFSEDTEEHIRRILEATERMIKEAQRLH